MHLTFTAYQFLSDRLLWWKEPIWASCPFRGFQLTKEKPFSYVRWKSRNGQLAQMGSFHQRKRSDNKWYALEVRWGIFIENLTYCFFIRAVVNIPIQTLIIPLWLLLYKMIISQLELGPPVLTDTLANEQLYFRKLFSIPRFAFHSNSLFTLFRWWTIFPILEGVCLLEIPHRRVCLGKYGDFVYN